MANDMLRPMSASPWKFDSTLNRWYLEIGGLRVIESDANGNLFIPGRVLKS